MSMKDCIFKLEFDDEILNFETEEQLNNFILENYDRLNLKVRGQKIQASKPMNISKSASEMNILVQKAIVETSQQGGAQNEYNLDLGSKVEHPLQGQKNQGYIGISTHIDEKEVMIDGELKKIIMSYRREKHIEKIVFKYISARLGFDKKNYLQFNDDERIAYDAEKNFIQNDSTEKLQLETYINSLITRYENANKSGRLIHAAIQLSLIELTQFANFTEFQQKFNTARLMELLDPIEITGVTSNEKYAYVNAIHSMILGTQNSPGLIKDLRLDKQKYIYPELAITYDNDDTGRKLMGIIDLLVIEEDKDGNASVHLYDFKTSMVEDHAWANEKHFRINAQLGYYNAMLKSKGIHPDTVQHVPIIIDTKDNYTTIASVTAKSAVNIKTNLIPTKFRDEFSRIRIQVASDIPEVLQTQQLSDLGSLTAIDDYLQKAFNFDYKQQSSKVNLEKSFENFWERNYTKDHMGLKKRFIQNPLNGEEIFLPNDKEEQKKVFIQLKQEYNAREGNKSLIDIYANAISYYKKSRADQDTFEKKESIPFVMSQKNSNTSSKSNQKFVKLFGKYRGDEWTLLDNSTANSLGLMLFVNNITNVIDIIAISPDNLEHEHPLNHGKTLLGNVYSNTAVANQKDLPMATYGNIELMKIMAFLNFNADYFAQNNLRIGDIKQINAFSRGTFNNYNTLKDLFYRTLNALNMKENYVLGKAKINLINPIEALMLNIANIDDFKNYKKYGFSEYSQFKGFVEKLKPHAASPNYWAWGEQQVEIMETLTERLKMLLQSQSVETFSTPDESSYFTKLIVDQINYYDKSYIPKYEEQIQKSSLMMNSIKNIPSPLIQSTNKILSVAIENIKLQYLNYREGMHKVTEELFDNNGYLKPRRYTLGDHANSFVELFQKINGKIDPRYILKNPYKDNSLNESQKKYVIAFLERINNLKNPENPESLQELLNGQNADEYLQVPLVKARALTLTKRGDFKNLGKALIDKVYNPLTYEYGSEPIADKDFLEVQNYFARQREKRKEMLEEQGIAYFETDLEAVLDLFTLSHLRAKEFDKALPLVASAKVASIMENQGVLRDVEPMVDFINNHLKIVVEGEKLTEGKMEQTADKYMSIARQLTSIFNLALNPISIARELTSSMYGAMSRAQFQYYGENSHSMSDLQRAWGIILGQSSKDLYSDMNIIEALNIQNGLSNMNLQSMIDRSSTSKTGLPYFFSNHIQGFNRAPEYLTRLGIFIAELIKDGAWEAHTYISEGHPDFNGKNRGLHYNWKKDKRFSVYASGNKSDIKTYNNQRSLYLKLLEEFNINRSGSELLKEGDALPQAYTSKQVESLKAFSDSILGYYDPESKYQVMSTLLGANFFHFKNWMTATKDKWLLTGQISEIQGQYVPMKNELGEIMYVQEDGSLTTDSKSGQIAYIWEGKWNEGILMSINRLIRASKGEGLSSGLSLLKQDRKIQSNIKLMILDTLMIALMLMLLRHFFADKDKEDLTFTSQILKAVVSQPSDLQVDKNITSVLQPQGWIFPSFSYFNKLTTGLYGVVVGDKSGEKWFYSSVGLLRPFQHTIDE